MQVEIEKVFKASPEKIYSQFTDPAHVSKWFGVKTVIDPQVGGTLKLDFGERELTTGFFLRLEPNAVISFTWNALVDNEPTGETIVTINLKPASNGYTLMTLVHTGFTSSHAQGEHKSAWKDYYSLWDRMLAQ